MAVDALTPVGVPRLVAYGARDAEWFEDALYASGGLRRVTSDEVRDALYEVDSIVPAGGWLRMDPAAFDMVDVDEGPVFDRLSVIHFQVPSREHPEVLERMAGIVHLDKASIDASAEAKAVDAWFNGWIASAFGIARDVQRLGVSSNYGGMYTSTFDRTSARLIGLHIDSWDGTRLGARRRSRYRACFNAGPEPRWFLFAPVALERLAGAIFPAGFDDDTAFLPAASELLDAGAISRVAALRLRPGEGYLAPTDAIFHDVSTLWARRSNINVQLLFDPEACNAFTDEAAGRSRSRLENAPP